MKRLPLISIIVLNWNGKRYIDPFMNSVNKLSTKNFNLEVLFTDNDSSDDSVEYYCKNYLDDQKFRLVQNDGNYGYAKGNNLGIQQARGDFILVSNNDLELDPNLVEELYKGIQSTKADLVVPKLMFLNKKGFINNAGSRLDENSSWPFYEIGYDELDKGQYDEQKVVSAFCGACVLFRKSFFETVGMYDDKFFMYFEDGDLSWRGQKAGKKFYYIPTALAYHHHAGSSKEWSPLFSHYVYRNRMLVLIKNARPRIILSGWKVTLHDHFKLRLRNVVNALKGNYSKKMALVEFGRGSKIILSAIIYTPYILFKRYKILKEKTI